MLLIVVKLILDIFSIDCDTYNPLIVFPSL